MDSAISAGKQAAKKVQEAAEEIYLGFEKGDYAPRIGRKGRVVKDDPRKYPERTVLTGGWSGGEAGLKQWIEVGTSAGSCICHPCGGCSSVCRAEYSIDYLGSDMFLQYLVLRSEAPWTGRWCRSCTELPH